MSGTKRKVREREKGKKKCKWKHSSTNGNTLVVTDLKKKRKEKVSNSLSRNLCAKCTQESSGMYYTRCISHMAFFSLLVVRMVHLYTVMNCACARVSGSKFYPVRFFLSCLGLRMEG